MLFFNIIPEVKANANANVRQRKKDINGPQIGKEAYPSLFGDSIFIYEAYL